MNCIGRNVKDASRLLPEHGLSGLQLHCAIDDYNSGSFTGPLKRLNEKTNICKVLITVSSNILDK